MLAVYRQVYGPLGNSLGLSSIVAVLPLVALFVLLGVLRMLARFGAGRPGLHPRLAPEGRLRRNDRG